MLASTVYMCNMAFCAFDHELNFFLLNANYYFIPVVNNNAHEQFEFAGNNEIESPMKRTSKKTSDPKKRKSRPQPSPEDDQSRNEDE